MPRINTQLAGAVVLAAMLAACHAPREARPLYHEPAAAQRAAAPAAHAATTPVR